jgi:hypothetical protein
MDKGKQFLNEQITMNKYSFKLQIVKLKVYLMSKNLLSRFLKKNTATRFFA